MTDGTVLQVQSWLDRLHAGDADLESLLLNFVNERWRALARRALHGSHKRLERFEETEGLLSELSIRLLQDWRRGSVPATAADFFRHTATNFSHLLVDLCRKHYGRDFQRQPALPLEPGGEGEAQRHEPGTDTLDPAQLAYWTEFHAQVDALPEDLRAVFQLRWYHDLTTEETALALGVSSSLVSKRWIAARLRLQQKLQNQPFDIQPG